MNCRKIVILLSIFTVLTSCSTKPLRRHAPAAEQAADPLDEGLDSASSAGMNSAPDLAPPSAAPTFISTGGRTKYQTVAEGFDSANYPADLTDFDSLDEPSPRTSCFSVKAAEPSTLSDFVIKQMMVQVEGNPDYGPLFPGSTDRVEPRLVIGKNNGWVNSQNLPNEKRQVFELGRMANSLVIKIIENKFGIYQDIGAPAEVWIRKNREGLVFFRVYKVDLEHKRTEVFSGYCFRK